MRPNFPSRPRICRDTQVNRWINDGSALKAKTTGLSPVQSQIQPLINPLEWSILLGKSGLTQPMELQAPILGARALLLWGESLLPVLVRLATPSLCGSTGAISSASATHRRWPASTNSADPRRARARDSNPPTFATQGLSVGSPTGVGLVMTVSLVLQTAPEAEPGR